MNPTPETVAAALDAVRVMLGEDLDLPHSDELAEIVREAMQRDPARLQLANMLVTFTPV